MNRLNEKSYGELNRDQRFEGGVINGGADAMVW